MAETLAELRSLPDEEIVARHDNAAGHTLVGTNHYLTELARQDQERQTQVMVRYTLAITIMTLIVTIATIVNVIAAVVTVSLSGR